MTVELEQSDAMGEAILRLTGPSDVWFGIGFNALTMAERPYAIIVDGSNGDFQERQLGKYQAGTPLNISLQEVSDHAIINGECQVELRRPLAAPSPFHFTFNPAASSLNIMAAVGEFRNFGLHAASDAGEMSLVRK